MTLSFVPYRQLVQDTLAWCEQPENHKWRTLGGVIGIPKSGMLPAQVVASRFNIPLVSLEHFLSTGGRFYPGRGGRGNQYWHGLPDKRCSVLIIDDSIHEGSTLRNIKQEVLNYLPSEYDIYIGAVYGSGYCKEFSYYKEIPLPRLFEWNWQKHPMMKEAIFDMDGVICEDWPGSKDDDISVYEKWLEDVKPLYLPTQRIRAIATARIEKYREVTEKWLDRWHVLYDELEMADCTIEEIRAKGNYAEHKAIFYVGSASPLFIESELWQCEYIAKKSGKSVLYPPRPNIEGKVLHVPKGN